jgi:hypothetical protein
MRAAERPSSSAVGGGIAFENDMVNGKVDLTINTDVNSTASSTDSVKTNRFAR